ncbi:DUF4350 domain-containing protein [Bacillus sp. FJAT-28004]|uniref:DUF4350 domain-containing protein n=1 Tax=Bacillus sp. FJAT-28004 TaxID=1679165 RepID=UPI0006B47B2C|nr:DUF4350 domain-containing protein [Bacillus sp. FJAT-28004]
MVNRFINFRNRTIAYAVIISMIAAFLGISGSVQAASLENGIALETSVGFQGYMKQNEWYPARLTLTNRTSEDLKGDVVVTITGANDLVIPVELPQGTAIQLTASIPGEVLNKNNSKIQFYKDSYKSGKIIPIIGNDYIDVRTASSYTIGVISRDPDTLNFMPSLNQRGYEITVIPIDEKELPNDPVLLKTLNTIVINDMATAGWTEPQIEAITNWVQQGGTLVLSGGAGYSKTAEAFHEISPLEASGTSTISSAASIASFGGTPLTLEKPLVISTGRIIDGKTDVAENNLPLVVSRNYGFGSVIYIAFDPSLEPMSTWAGSAMLWAKLLKNNLTPLQPGMMNSSNSMLWNIESIVDEFPSIKPPNFMLLLWMFVGYMIIVAPVLYIILAKTDRREWSWWLIPAFSVVTGVAIFFFGADDKRNLSAHTIEIIELTGQGDAVRSGATAVFIPSGGTVTAEFDKKENLIFYSNYNQNGNPATDGKTQLISENNTTTAVWRSVPYWSTRKVWMEKQTMNSDTGQLTLAYKQSRHSIEVSATNNTTTDLTNVSLLINGQAQLIGDLKRGESGQTTITKKTNNQSGYYPYGQMMFPYPSNRGKDDYNRERQLVDRYVNRGNGGIIPPDPLLIGFSTDHEQKYKVNGETIRTDNLKLWVQKVDTAFIDGNRVIVPAGLINPIITENATSHLENYGNGNYSIGEGELTFEYLLPNDHAAVYDHLEILFNSGTKTTNLALTVWNEKTGSWTDTNSAAAAPNEYLINNQMVRMKFSVIGSVETSLPQIALEGEIRTK